jgi:protein-disulfide isomerase
MRFKATSLRKLIRRFASLMLVVTALGLGGAVQAGALPAETNADDSGGATEAIVSGLERQPSPSEPEGEAGLAAAEERQGTDPQDPFGIADAPMRGATDGLVTIIEYSDFECPFCGRVNPTLKQVFDAPEYAGKVRQVFKQNPLPFHKNAQLAAEASLAARAQGKFWEMRDRLFENQRALTRSDLERYAREIGLNLVRFNKALDEHTYREEVAKDLADAGRAGVRGTPHFLINGKALSGAQPYEAFKSIIDTEIREMESLLRSGTPLGVAFGERVKANFKLDAAGASPSALAGFDPSDELFVPVGNSPVKGNPNAPVTIVMFSEFQCPFCARVEGTLRELEGKYGDSIRIVWKNNPLPFHERAEDAARAVLAAHAQGKFWEMHDLIFANQGALSFEDLFQYASELGLNMYRFEADMNAPTAAASIKEDQALAVRLAARGTPHFFINGFRLRGAQPAPKFIEIIDRELARAKSQMAKGTPAANVYKVLQASANRGEAKMLAGSAPIPGAQEAPKAPVEIPIGAAPSKGPANAKVTIVTYGDFQCPFCARFAANLDEAVGDNPDVRIVYKQFPLPFHNNADLAAQASLAAHAQGMFWEMHDMLYANQQQLARTDLEGYAEELGLDMERFRYALDSGIYEQTIKDEIAEGQKFGVQGTPSWFVNGVFQSGALPADAIRAKIAEHEMEPDLD